jgi:hypothetical protein
MCALWMSCSLQWPWRQPSKNITKNPTCEWHLRLYSKINTKDS